MKITINKAGSHSHTSHSSQSVVQCSHNNTPHLSLHHPHPHQARPGQGIKRKRQELTSRQKRRTGDTSKHGKSFLPVTQHSHTGSARFYFPKSSPQFVTEVSKQVATTQPNWVLILYHVSHSHSSAAINFKREADTQPLKEERNLKYLMSNKALKLVLSASSPPTV